MRSILTVCVGNICRSPLAESLLRVGLEGKAYVESAGLDALVGNPADETVQELLMAARGVDMTTHRARQIARHQCVSANLILVMESQHKIFLQNLYPFVRGKTFRLGEFGKFDVPDPYRRKREVYEKCFELVDRGVGDWIKQLNQLDGL